MKVFRFFALLVVATMSAGSLQAAADDSWARDMEEVRAERKRQRAELLHMEEEDRLAREIMREERKEAEQKAAAPAAQPAMSGSGSGGSAGYGDTENVRPRDEAYEDSLMGPDAGVPHYSGSGEGGSGGVRADGSGSGSGSGGADAEGDDKDTTCPICLELGATPQNRFITPYECSDEKLKDGKNAGHKIHQQCFDSAIAAGNGGRCSICRRPRSGQSSETGVGAGGEVDGIFVRNVDIVQAIGPDGHHYEIHPGYGWLEVLPHNRRRGFDGTIYTVGPDGGLYLGRHEDGSWRDSRGTRFVFEDGHRYELFGYNLFLGPGGFYYHRGAQGNMVMGYPPAEHPYMPPEVMILGYPEQPN